MFMTNFVPERKRKKGYNAHVKCDNINKFSNNIVSCFQYLSISCTQFFLCA